MSEKQKLYELETSPFKEPLEDTGRGSFGRIKQMKGFPDKLVREWPIDEIKEEADIELRIEKIKREMSIFNALQDRYGIPVVKTELVLGGDKKNPKIYMVVDKIYQENFTNKNLMLPMEAVEEADQFFSRVIEYYFDIYKKGGDYWWDFNFSQIVYGHKAGERENKFYIVDIEQGMRIL